MAILGSDFLAIPQDQSIPVMGTPSALRVDLPLLNSGGSPMVIRDSDVRARIVGKEGRFVPDISATLTTVIQAGQAGRGQLQLRVDMHTPPGDYAGEIEIGGSVRKLALTIIEQVRLSIDPNPIILDGSCGSTMQKAAVFRNLGNVPLHIRDPAFVTLGE